MQPRVAKQKPHGSGMGGIADGDLYLDSFVDQRAVEGSVRRHVGGGDPPSTRKFVPVT